MAKETVIGPIKARLEIGLDTVIINSYPGSQPDKQYNEDGYWPAKNVYQLIEHVIAGRLYIVADGVSGGLNGHQASRLAIQTVAENYYDNIFHLQHYPAESDIRRWLYIALLRANQKLLAESKKIRQQAGLSSPYDYLQTTVLCGLVRGQDLFVASLGNSRLYRLSAVSGRVSLISGPFNDQRVGAMLDTEQLLINRETVEPADILLFCTDGFYQSFNDTSLERMMAQIAQQFESVQPTLWTEAGQPDDDITLLAVKIPPASSLDEDRSVDQLIEIGWQDPFQLLPSSDEPGQTVAATLREYCLAKSRQATSIAENSQWERWARQLSLVKPAEQPELCQAQTLYRQLDLNFETNRNLIDQILTLHDQMPTNPQLQRIALNAILDLANLALLSSQEKQNLPEALDLLADFYSKAESTLGQIEKKEARQMLNRLKERFSQTDHAVQKISY